MVVPPLLCHCLARPDPAPANPPANPLADANDTTPFRETLRTSGQDQGQVWTDLLAAGDAWLLLPALHRALADKGWLDLPPREVADLLRSLHAANLARNRGILRAATTACATLEAGGARATLLKGAATLAMDLLPDPGVLLMQDIDLLVAEADVPAARRTLRQAGWNVASTSSAAPRGHHHLPPLRLAGCPATLEVHHALLPRPEWRAALPAARMLEAARRSNAGEGPRTPCLAHHLLHTALEGSLSQETHLQPRKVLAFCLLREAAGEAALAAAGAWPALREAFDAVGRRDALGEFLMAGEMLFRWPAPPEAGLCHRDRVAWLDVATQGKLPLPAARHCLQCRTRGDRPGRALLLLLAQAAFGVRALCAWLGPLGVLPGRLAEPWIRRLERRLLETAPSRIGSRPPGQSG